MCVLLLIQLHNFSILMQITNYHNILSKSVSFLVFLVHTSLGGTALSFAFFLFCFVLFISYHFHLFIQHFIFTYFTYTCYYLRLHMLFFLFAAGKTFMALYFLLLNVKNTNKKCIKKRTLFHGESATVWGTKRKKKKKRKHCLTLFTAVVPKVMFTSNCVTHHTIRIFSHTTRAFVQEYFLM